MSPQWHQRYPIAYQDLRHWLEIVQTSLCRATTFLVSWLWKWMPTTTTATKMIIVKIIITKGKGVWVRLMEMLLCPHCALRKFWAWVIEGPNEHAQIAFSAFHYFSFKVQANASYIHALHMYIHSAMGKTNLSIRIVCLVFAFLLDSEWPFCRL